MLQKLSLRKVITSFILTASISSTGVVEVLTPTSSQMAGVHALFQWWSNQVGELIKAVRQKLRERDMDLPCFTCGAASNKHGR